jgi:hypothetical protein
MSTVATIHAAFDLARAALARRHCTANPHDIDRRRTSALRSATIAAAPVSYLCNKALPRYSQGTPKATHKILTGYSRGTQRVLTGYSQGLLARATSKGYPQNTHRVPTGYSQGTHKGTHRVLTGYSQGTPRVLPRNRARTSAPRLGSHAGLRTAGPVRTFVSEDKAGLVGTRARVRVCVSARACVCGYACVHVCVYVCTYTCTHTNIHGTHTHACMHACMHASMHVCMHVCVHVGMHTSNLET